MHASDYADVHDHHGHLAAFASCLGCLSYIDPATSHMQVEAEELILHGEVQKTYWSAQSEMMSVADIAEKLQDPNLTHREQALLAQLLQMNAVFSAPLGSPQMAEMDSDSPNHHAREPEANYDYL